MSQSTEIRIAQIQPQDILRLQGGDLSSVYLILIAVRPLYSNTCPEQLPQTALRWRDAQYHKRTQCSRRMQENQRRLQDRSTGARTVLILTNDSSLPLSWLKGRYD
jgi:hypothetical protein